MPHFIFKAKKQTGEIYKGESDAADRFELYKMLREAGEEVVLVEEKASSKGLHVEISFGGLLGRVKTIDKINFARNLGLMLEAGLALSRALSVLERQAKSKALKKVIIDISASINTGMTFSDALAKHPKVFPQIFISMVHAGEQSGTLSESLKSVASQMDSSFTLTRRIRGAMIYPGVIMTVMIIIGILMMVFVVPTLLKTFTDLNADLPPTTQLVLTASNLVQNDGLALLAVLIVVGGSLFYWAKRDSGKKFFHKVILKLPIIGGLAHEVNAARTARTLSSLLSAGVEVVESVNITAAVVQNVYFRAVLKQAEEAIKKGELMSKTFAGHEELYPTFFAEMLSVGEETGRIGDMLHNVAHYYESDVEQRTKDMSTIIEPILIVVIGGAVGFFAIAMIQPMYSLVNVIH
jgi:type IV pilus assembly protein PilC